jgi:hypothetical protein
MMEDSVADNSGVIAILMEATDAPIEDVTLALEICGGNEKQALEMLNGGGEDNFNTQSARALLNEKPKTSLENPPPRMDSAPTFIDDAPQRAMRSHQAKVTDEKGIDDDLVTKPPETPMYAPTLRTSPTATSKASENIKGKTSVSGSALCRKVSQYILAFMHASYSSSRKQEIFNCFPSRFGSGL